MKGFKWFFITCLILAILVYGLVFFNVPAPNWVRFYAADFLCMPIVLSVCLFIVRRWKQAPRMQLSLLSILSLTTFYSLYFEAYLPPRSERYTGDIWDVVMYFTGAMLFYFIQKYSSFKPKNTSNTPTS